MGRNGLSAIPNFRARAPRRAPRAGCRRAWPATRGSPPPACALREQHGELHVAVRLRQRCGGDIFGGTAGERRHHLRGAPAQLLVGRAHVHHQAAIDLAEPHHHHRREQVQHDLLRRARLEPRRAGDRLGAGLDQDRMFARLRSCEPGLLAMPTVIAPRCRARLHRRNGERRVAAGGKADHDIVRADADLLHARRRRPQVNPRRPRPPAAARLRRRRWRNTTRSCGQLKVGVSSAPSCTPMRPDVPAPT